MHGGGVTAVEACTRWLCTCLAALVARRAVWVDIQTLLPVTEKAYDTFRQFVSALGPGASAKDVSLCETVELLSALLVEELGGKVWNALEDACAAVTKGESETVVRDLLVEALSPDSVDEAEELLLEALSLDSVDEAEESAVSREFPFPIGEIQTPEDLTKLVAVGVAASLAEMRRWGRRSDVDLAKGIATDAVVKVLVSYEKKLNDGTWKEEPRSERLRRLQGVAARNLTKDRLHRLVREVGTEEQDLDRSIHRQSPPPPNFRLDSDYYILWGCLRQYNRANATEGQKRAIRHICAEMIGIDMWWLRRMFRLLFNIPTLSAIEAGVYRMRNAVVSAIGEDHEQLSQRELPRLLQDTMVIYNDLAAELVQACQHNLVQGVLDAQRLRASLVGTPLCSGPGVMPGMQRPAAPSLSADVLVARLTAWIINNPNFCPQVIPRGEAR